MDFRIFFRGLVELTLRFGSDFLETYKSELIFLHFSFLINKIMLLMRLQCIVLYEFNLKVRYWHWIGMKQRW